MHFHTKLKVGYIGKAISLAFILVWDIMLERIEAHSNSFKQKGKLYWISLHFPMSFQRQDVQPGLKWVCIKNYRLIRGQKNYTHSLLLSPSLLFLSFWRCNLSLYSSLPLPADRLFSVPLMIMITVLKKCSQSLSNSMLQIQLLELLHPIYLFLYYRLLEELV